MSPVFLIAAPDFTHRSAGVRALYRLCHHLNTSGYPAAMVPMPGHELRTRCEWRAPRHDGPIGDAILVYPEVVSGNPFGAQKVVRWALNNPGLLGGDTSYADSEMVFVFNPDRIPIMNRAVRVPIGRSRVLNFGLIDPQHIHPDRNVRKTLTCVFTGRAAAVRGRHPLTDGLAVAEIERMTPTVADLGDVLRRTETLYSYEHVSNILKEAAISGCQVLVPDDAGRWHDPETCNCPHNIHWVPGFRQNYARRFRDHRFVRDFVRELETRWAIPEPAWRFRAAARVEDTAIRLGLRRDAPLIHPRAPNLV